MKSFDSDTLDRFDKGQVDYLDGMTGMFDDGPLNVFIGQPGKFDYEDTVLGTLEFVGSGALLSIDIPVAKTGNETEAIEVRVAEEYLPAGSTSPKSLWEDVGGEIDAVEWQWREVLLHVFWRAEDGSILYREQVGRRVIDSMRVEIDNQGRAVRILTLELPAITQRDIAAKTSNAQLQKLIDPTDKGFEHTARTAVQKFTLGKAQDQKVK